MPGLAANLRYLFTELPYLERFEAAAQAGFKAVEYQFPYDHALADSCHALRQSGLDMVLINMPPGNWNEGDRGTAACPGREAEFRLALAEAIDYAQALNCPRINVLAGIPATTTGAMDVLCANLELAAKVCAKAQMDVMLEAINATDMPGYFIADIDQALAIIKLVAVANLQLQFDAYHVAMCHDDPVGRLLDLPIMPGHIQIADCPGRHEPGTGVLEFDRFFSALEQIGYTGWVGCEYQPATTTGAGLIWAGSYLGE